MFFIKAFEKFLLGRFDLLLFNDYSDTEFCNLLLDVATANEDDWETYKLNGVSYESDRDVVEPIEIEFKVLRLGHRTICKYSPEYGLVQPVKLRALDIPEPHLALLAERKDGYCFYIV